MKICVPVRIGECRTLLRQNLDSRFDFGMERHVGWVIAYFFSMSYHSKNEIRLLDGLIFHKAMGFLSGKKENTSVYFVVFKGLTDPISIFFLFSVNFLVFWLAWERKGASFLTCIFLALLCTVSAGGATYFVSAFSSKGRREREHLIETLRNLLTNMTGV